MTVWSNAGRYHEAVRAIRASDAPFESRSRMDAVLRDDHTLTSVERTLGERELRTVVSEYRERLERVGNQFYCVRIFLGALALTSWGIMSGRTASKWMIVEAGEIAFHAFVGALIAFSLDFLFSKATLHLRLRWLKRQ